MQRTLVLIKPDAVGRGIVGQIISRLEVAGCKIAEITKVQANKDLAETHYEEHRGKPFFEELVEFTASGPVIPIILEAPDAIALVRTIQKKIREEFFIAGSPARENCIHASDSEESALREINLWFSNSSSKP